MSIPIRNLNYFYPMKPASLPFGRKFWELCNNPNWIIEVKRNGQRCLAVKEEYKEGIELWSRHRTYISEPLQELRQQLFEMLPDETIIDGELIKGKRAEGLEGDTYYIFDVYQWAGEIVSAKPLVLRKEMLNLYIKESDCIQLAQPIIIKFTEDYKRLFEEPGVEGVVFKYLESPYIIGWKESPISYYWLKCKERRM